MASDGIDSRFGDTSPFAASFRLLGMRLLIFGLAGLMFAKVACARRVEIEGVVTHSETGEVITGAYVVVSQETYRKRALSYNEPVQLVRTDQEGRFRFTCEFSADGVRVEVVPDLCEWFIGSWRSDVVSDRQVIEIEALRWTGWDVCAEVRE